MKLIEVVCITLLLIGAASAEDLIFFADDHYKAIGTPRLNASAVSPALQPGDCILRINLANLGQVEELMPISGNGSKEDISKEMQEEMHCTDALNIQAALQDFGPLHVTSGPQHIACLSAGGLAELQFNITVAGGASGWYEIPLRLDYERQADVSVSNGEATPLYLPENSSFGILVFVNGNLGPLGLLGSRSDLAAARGGPLWAAIKNEGPEDLHNCSARLLTASPFHSEGRSDLGDLPSGGVAMASFSLRADGNASLQDYQLACAVDCMESNAVLALPITLAKSENPFMAMMLPAAALIMLAGAAAILIQKRQEKLWPRRGRSR
jgi:hypothetical protein